MGTQNFSRHISKQFDTELAAIQAHVIAMGALVEQQIKNAITAMNQHDAVLAQHVIEGDDKVNQMEIMIDEACVRIIARRQPAASDLRLIVTIVKMISELERISDAAEKICRMALENFLKQQEPLLINLETLGKHTLQMFHDALMAFKKMDIGEAMRIYHEDRKVDEAYKNIIQQLITVMTQDPHVIPHALTALFCARAIERIGDRCQNICEFIFYLIKGQDLRHQDRDKVDAFLEKGKNTELIR